VEFLEYNSKGTDLKIQARKLEGREVVKCPKHNKNWVGAAGDFHIKLPSGESVEQFTKSADLKEPVKMIVHGAEFVVKPNIFADSYELVVKNKEA